MFQKKTNYNQINIILVLVAVFLLILGTNRIDKRHFETAQNAVNSVYNDRVLAQDYIFKMNKLIYEKQIHQRNITHSINAGLNKEIETLISAFAETNLTVNEADTFSNFKKNFIALKNKEDYYYEHILFQDLDSLEVSKFIDKLSIKKDLLALQTDLNNLALIQVSESKNVMGVAQKSLNANKLLSNMEIYLLLAIGIIVLFITFYRIGNQET